MKNKNIQSIFTKFDAYLESEVRKELERKSKNIDPEVNILGYKMPLSEFDRRLDKAMTLLGQSILKKILSNSELGYIFFGNDIIKCFTEKSSSKESEK